MNSVCDRVSILNRGGSVFNEENCENATEFLGSGHHSDDVTREDRRAHEKRLFRSHPVFPREYLINWLEQLGIDNRPKPMGSTTTNALN